MRFFKNVWPTPEEERSGAWKRYSLVVQCVFFFLTTLAVVALLLLSGLHSGWFVMLVCIGVGELLIRRGRFWRTGVEAALWIGGLYAGIFSLPSNGEPEALLVLGAAAAIAGWRVRNALFGTIAVCFVVAYLAVQHANPLTFALMIATIALLAVTREWRRPSTELLWQMLLIVMPVAGYVAEQRAPLVFASFAAVCVFAGLRARLRMPLIAAAICVTLAVVAAKLPLSIETQLVIGGAIALSLAAIVARILKRRERGFVLDLPQQSDLEAILSIAPLTAASHAASPQPIGGGGEFGGAGASGNF